MSNENIPMTQTTESPQMENVTRMDKDGYFEAVMARGKALKRRIFSALGIVCAVVGLLMANRIVVVCGLLVTLLALFSHLLIGYRDFQKLKVVHPTGEWEKTTRFFEDYMEVDTGDGQPKRRAYKDIRREYETEHMYVVEFGKEVSAMTFRKDGFTKGSFEEFQAYLTDKQRQYYDVTASS